MIRTEAHACVGGMLLTVSGVCTGLRHDGGKCEPVRRVVLVDASRIEVHGVAAALVDALANTLYQFPEISDLILC